tara:strand:+ start:12173 stop:14665 length:2493 start_codon:yes stop_codon:yes gene_type:complete
MLYHNLKHKNYKQLYTDNITAVLGPTNTGKTHYAIEQMLKYKSGMIGCPLRLLAREIYDKLVIKKGILNIALITGEERIIPHTAKYFVCTVEAMPKNLSVDFVAIDEVQLSAHSERGHVFTDKLLNIRGKIETILLGSENLEILLKKIFSHIFIKKMKRFSNIEYLGDLKLSRMPPRSAIVTFSVNEVYEIAELLKRRHGGTAVVLGALSPKTRNAQVELYESGEVDYLVATDAIGMGLNMDISHVAFARLTKFDGKMTRSLTFSEVAQVAGRAGRYKKDGTFGSTLGCDAFTPSMINAIETHSFPEIKSVLWRNSNLDFSSVKMLIRSLGARSNKPHFIMSPEAEDEKLLKLLSNKLDDNNNLKLLWEVCSIPDYGKNFDDSHVNLLENIYKLIRENGEIPEIWSKNNLDNLNNIKGELDLLAKRLANVRTWNYIFNKTDWVENSYELSSRTKYVENRLSDALHKGLVDRFVDYKMARFAKHLKVNNDLVASISNDNLVKIEGHYVGRLEGLKFVNEVSKNMEDEREILRIIRKFLSFEVSRKVKLIKDCNDNKLSFDKNLNIYFNGVYMARLGKGSKLLKPKIVLDSIDLLSDWDQKVLKRRFLDFLNKRINKITFPLTNIMNKFNFGILKGIAYQLRESLGVIKIKNVKELIENLNKKEKKLLNNEGVIIGEIYIWYPTSIKKNNAEFIWKLFQIYNGLKPKLNYPDIDKPVESRNIPENLLSSREFVLIGNYIYGIELIENIAKFLKKLSKSKNIFYLNKKNIGIIDKNYSLSYEQIKNILNLLKFKKDKNNPAKYLLNHNVCYKTNLLGKNKHIKNSPFSVLAKI